MINFDTSVLSNDFFVKFFFFDISENLLSNTDTFFKVLIGSCDSYADLSKKIFFPFFLIIPFFSSSEIFLLTLSLGIFKSFEICIRLILLISSVLSL